jgi:hypothetical protein
MAGKYGIARSWQSNQVVESMAVRHYADLSRPYLMTFIGFSGSTVDWGVYNNPWCIGVATATNPAGPWMLSTVNPSIPIGTQTGFDQWITAEATHVLTNRTMYIFYSGGKTNGANQIGLLTFSTSEVERREIEP